MKKRVFEMTEEEKQKFIEVNGKTMLYLAEARNIFDIAEKVNLEPRQVYENINEMLYILLKHVGVRRFLKTLFIR